MPKCSLAVVLSFEDYQSNRRSQVLPYEFGAERDDDEVTTRHVKDSRLPHLPMHMTYAPCHYSEPRQYAWTRLHPF